MVYLREEVTYLNSTAALWVGGASTTVQKFEATLNVSGSRTDWKLQIGNNNVDINAVILIDNIKIQYI